MNGHLYFLWRINIYSIVIIFLLRGGLRMKILWSKLSVVCAGNPNLIPGMGSIDQDGSWDIRHDDSNPLSKMVNIDDPDYNVIYCFIVLTPFPPWIPILQLPSQGHGGPRLPQRTLDMVYFSQNIRLVRRWSPCHHLIAARWMVCGMQRMRACLAENSIPALRHRSSIASITYLQFHRVLTSTTGVIATLVHGARAGRKGHRVGRWVCDGSRMVLGLSTVSTFRTPEWHSLSLLKRLWW
jgi:hypothetical protein